MAMRDGHRPTIKERHSRPVNMIVRSRLQDKHPKPTNDTDTNDVHEDLYH